MQGNGHGICMNSVSDIPVLLKDNKQSVLFYTGLAQLTKFKIKIKE